MASALDPGAILAQLTANFMKLPLSQKIFLPVIIIGSIWGIVYVAQWATRPDYSVLYSDLEPADAAAVVEYLKSHNIKYQVRGKGDIIAVSPPELVQETRLALASEGIPKGGTVGFELFDSTSFVATGFVEKLKFIRAVQGELERTIASLDSVVAARVHVAQPDKTVFARKQNKPTASVLLKLKPGGELTKKQIKGIANLVAGSIEGLNPEDVTIVDTHGNPLSDRIKKKEEPFGADATQIQYQHAVEEAYVKRIESMLAKVLGPDKVIARVTADLDFSMVEKQEESYDPGGQVARSEKTIEERVGTEEKGGIPGVVSNLTANPEAAGINQSQGNVKRRESVS
ncbi:MAG: flagellar M-ring protein FliF, partial [Candidatus Dadabacteria bacterium]